MRNDSRRRSDSITSSPRAIEAVPASVSDALVLERLGARTEDDLAGPSIEAVREARVVAFLLGLHASALLPVQGGTPLWDVSVDADVQSIGARLGIDSTRVEAAIQRLVRVGAVSREAGGRIRFAEVVCGPRGPSDEIPWTEIITRLHGQLSPIVVCRAIARHKERCEHPVFEFSPVPDSALGKLTGFSASTIRRVRSRLREAEVLEEQRMDGAPSVYRFARILQPAGGGSGPAAAAPVSRGPTPFVAAAAPSPPGSPQTYVVPEGVVVEAFGSPLALPAGFQVEIGDGVGAIRIEKDPQGRDVLRLGALTIRRA